jgi:hypothetical protein
LKSSFAQEVLVVDEADELVGFGRGRRNTPQLGPASLFVKSLCIENGGTLHFFVSVDSLYISEKVVREAISLTKNRSVHYENIIIASTHTHSSPNLESRFCEKVVSQSFQESVTNSIVSIFGKNLSSLKKSSLELLEVDSCKTINRRMMGRDIRSFFLKSKMIMRPNRKRLFQNNIKCLYDTQSKTVLFNFACHPVFNIGKKFSSDFPGEIGRKLIESNKFENAIFMQGFAGDIRPDFTTSGLKSFKYGLITFSKALVHGEAFHWFTKHDFDQFCDMNSQQILKNISREKIAATVSFKKKSLEFPVRSETGQVTHILGIKFLVVDKIIFVSIGAEVLYKFQEMFEKEFPDFTFFCIGYADRTIGYLPFDDDLAAGGYESSGSHQNYGFDSKISLDCILELKHNLISELSNILGE